jgi:hypothetical protein
MVSPVQYQSLQPKHMKYRFNWNAPVIYSMHESGVFYHAGNGCFAPPIWTKLAGGVG